MFSCNSMLDLFFFFKSDDRGSCKVKRKVYPCLACKGSMDLVEITQSMELCFMPTTFNAKTMSFLDCPDCGFSTSRESYNYLKVCQSDAEGLGMPNESEIDGEKSLSCAKCKSKIATYYLFCPTCGTKRLQKSSFQKEKKISFHKEMWDCFHDPMCGRNRGDGDDSSYGSKVRSGNFSDTPVDPLDVYSEKVFMDRQ